MPAMPPRTCTQARTASHGASNGDVAAGDAARADLAQRQPVRPDEEAADERLLVAARGAPGLQPGLAAQDRDAQLGALGVVTGDVGHRARAVGELEAGAADTAGAGRAKRLGGGEGHVRRMVRASADGVNSPLA